MQVTQSKIEKSFIRTITYTGFVYIVLLHT